MKFASPTRFAGLFLASFVFLTAVIPKNAAAQSDYPTSIVYLVRDDKGELLDPAKLQSVSSEKGEEMKPGTTFIKKADENTTITVKCLASRLDLGGGPVKLSKLKLEFNNITMNLIFNATAKQERKLIDSIPFRTGTFELTKGEWVEVKK